MALKIANIKYLVCGTMLLLGSMSAMSADISVNVNIPGEYQRVPVIIQPAPIYVQPQPVFVSGEPVYVERNDRYWDCKKDKCKSKKAKRHKHKDHDED